MPIGSVLGKTARSLLPGIIVAVDIVRGHGPSVWYEKTHGWREPEFPAEYRFLRLMAVDVRLVADADCIALMKRFIAEHLGVVGRRDRRPIEGLVYQELYGVLSNGETESEVECTSVMPGELWSTLSRTLSESVCQSRARVMGSVGTSRK